MKINRLKRIKIALILCFLAFGVIGLFTNDRMIQTVRSNIAGPPAGSTAAPGEGNCTFCHAPNSGVGQFTIIAPASYTSGQTYQIVVGHTTTDQTRKRWGFQLTALAGGAAAGSFANLSALTQTFHDFDFDRNYVEHTSNGTFQNQTGGAQWTFNWIAPAGNPGDVTFYAAGNQANNDGTNNGDQMYLAQAVSQSSAPTTPTRPQLRLQHLRRRRFRSWISRFPSRIRPTL